MESEDTTTQSVQKVEEEFDYSDFFDDESDEIVVPRITEIAKGKGITRSKAKEVALALRREAEGEAEAMAPSGDEHLDKLINAPILEAIKEIGEDNRELQKKIKDGDLYSDDGITPQEARKQYRDNLKTLVELKNSLSAGVKQAGAGGTSIHMDLGSIFNEALVAARAVDGEGPIIESI
jgi:hypothetical protein